MGKEHEPSWGLGDIIKYLGGEQHATLESVHALSLLRQAADLIKDAAEEKRDSGIKKQALGIAREIGNRIPSLFTVRGGITDVSITLGFQGSSEAISLVTEALSDPEKTVVERGNFCIIPTKVEGLWIVRTMIDGQQSYRLAGERAILFAY